MKRAHVKRQVQFLDIGGRLPDKDAHLSADISAAGL